MNNEQSFSFFPMFRDFIPDRFRLWIILFFPLVFQASNPLFMGLSAQQAGSLSLIREDIMMCGFTSIIGITCTFPIVFRLKFRFTTRQILLTVSLGLALLNLFTLHCRLMPLLVIASFLYGILKLWGTFECVSSALPKISPNHILPPFLAVVFTIVFCGVELSCISGIYINHLYNWQHVSYFVMASLLFLALLSAITMQDFRFKPPVPLLSVDWLGMLLWGILLGSISFVFIYGDYLNWFVSPYIRIASAISLFAFGLNFGRMMTILHPYIEPQLFCYRNIWNVLIIFMISGLMLSSQSVLEHIFTGSILNFGEIRLANLNWITIAGLCIGSIFSYFALTKWGWNTKQMTFLSILFTTMYVTSMFFLISPHTTLEQLYIPSLFNGIGHTMLFITLTAYMEGNVPFPHRFQILMVLGLIRTGIASPIGGAFFGHLFKIEMSKNSAWLASDISHISVSQLPFTTITNEVIRQSMLVSVRNLFGIAVLIGLLTLIIILASRFRNVSFRLLSFNKIHKILLQRIRS